MPPYLYTFVGGVEAIYQLAKRSKIEDSETVLEACEKLRKVSHALLQQADDEASLEDFKKSFKKHVFTVPEAIDVLRNSSLRHVLEKKLNQLLDYFYDAALSLRKGGTGSMIWPRVPDSFWW